MDVFLLTDSGFQIWVSILHSFGGEPEAVPFQRKGMIRLRAFQADFE